MNKQKEKVKREKTQGVRRPHRDTELTRLKKHRERERVKSTRYQSKKERQKERKRIE